MGHILRPTFILRKNLFPSISKLIKNYHTPLKKFEGIIERCHPAACYLSCHHFGIDADSNSVSLLYISISVTDEPQRLVQISYTT